MKILHLVKAKPDETVERIMNTQRESHSVGEIDLRTEKDYGKIVDAIVDSDLVISW